jgi:hypothetical protein
VDTKTPNLIVDGPVAFHDVPCAVFYMDQPSVYDIDRDVFIPSWAAQEKGWQLVHADTWWKRILLRLLKD